jgi:hypothetical protein
MGAWGYGIFSDDVACDVRDDYREALEDGLADAAATAHALEKHADVLADEDDAAVVWVSLALTQWSLGRLDEAVSREALATIDQERGLSRWAEQGPKAVAQRRAALAKARAKLVSPQPPRRAVRRPKPRTTDLLPGDVLAYRTKLATIVLLRVVDLESNKYWTAPQIAVLDYAGKEIPELDVIERLRDRPPSTVPGPTYRLAGFTPIRLQGHDWRDEGFERIGRIPIRPAQNPDAISGMGRWDTYADWFEGYARKDAGV